MLPPDAYFAGLIDGEGYVDVAGLHGNRKRKRPCIKVCMTDRRPLLLCRQRFGGYIATKKRHAGMKPHWKTGFYWSIAGQRAKAAAHDLLPFCVVKRKGLQRILKWNPIDIRRYIKANGARLSMVEWSRRSAIPYRTIQARLQAGWSPALAVTIRPAHENGLRRLYRRLYRHS